MLYIAPLFLPIYVSVWGGGFIFTSMCKAMQIAIFKLVSIGITFLYVVPCRPYVFMSISGRCE